MEISEIRVGMTLDMCCQRSMDFIQWARVEAVAVDWFVVRDEDGEPWFVDYGVWDLWIEDQTC